MTQDRMTVARAALEKAAKAFREYETHHTNRATNNPLQPAKLAADSMAKAQRNRDLATECEMALNLLTAE